MPPSCVTTRVGFILALLILGMSNVSAGEWFAHRFAELRAYHGAWLNVCEDKGAGACRTVQTYIPKGVDRFFGQSKLTVYVEASGAVSLEVYDEGMPTLKDVVLEFDFGSETITVHPEYWQTGGKGITNLKETIYIPPGEVATTLVGFIRAKNRLVVRYPRAYGETGEAPFSLRGSSAALRAIQSHLKARSAGPSIKAP